MKAWNGGSLKCVHPAHIQQAAGRRRFATAAETCGF